MPPPLPYSPNSHPFKRQIEILSLYISGASANESWKLYYEAIHPDLHRYIPDHTFRSLITHQLGNPDPDLRWRKSAILLRFAMKCRMEAKDLGQDILEKAFREGVGYVLESTQSTTRASLRKNRLFLNFAILRQVWDYFTQLADNQLYRIPLEIRQLWLEIHSQRSTYGGSVLRNAHQEEAVATLVRMIRYGGGKGIEAIGGDIISDGHSMDPDVQHRALCLVVELSHYGFEVPAASTIAIMTKLYTAVERKEGQGIVRLQDAVSSLITKLQTVSSASEPVIRYLESCLEQVVKPKPSITQKAVDLLESGEARVPTLVRRGLKLVETKGADEERLTRIDLTISLLERALRRRDAECKALIARLLVSLVSPKKRAERQTLTGRDAYKHRDLSANPSSPTNLDTSPGPDIVSRLDDSPSLDDLVARLAHVLLASDILLHLDSNLVHFLFHLVISSEPSDRSYVLARGVYPFARSTEPAFNWSHRNLYLWRSLFHYTIGPERRHLHFASRLYADLMADGVSIRRTDAIAMVRAIGTTRGASRRILLERHVKDYLYMEYGSRQAFLTAIVKGLTARRRGDDALLAFNAIMRLSTEKPVPGPVAQLLLDTLPADDEGVDHRYFLDLIRSLPAEAETATYYNSALHTLISPSHRRLSPNDSLSRAVDIYKDMIARQIPPNGRTISYLIRGLCEADYLDSALGVFRASLDAGFEISSHATGSFMVLLGTKGRYEDAEGVGKMWQSRAENNEQKHGDREYNRGIVAACYMLDFERGRKVDVKRVKAQGRWKNEPAFERYLESLKPSVRADSVTKEGTDLFLTSHGFETVMTTSPAFKEVRDHETASTGAEPTRSTTNGGTLSGRSVQSRTEPQIVSHDNAPQRRVGWLAKRNQGREEDEGESGINLVSAGSIRFVAM